MGLFWKKEKKETASCGCGGQVGEELSCGCGGHEGEESGCDCGCGGHEGEAGSCGCGCGDRMEDEISGIKVLGSGCKACHTLYENVEKVVKDLDFQVETEYVTDMEKIAGYGVMSMPALVVNEKVVAMGKVLKEDEIRKILLQ